jgi:hypothetical protein
MNGWIKWEGGECPVPPETPVFVLMRSGNSEKVGLRASSYLWAHRKDGCGDGDIVAYKVAEKEKDMIGYNGTKADDLQVSGTHYKDMEMQPWHVMEAVLTPEEFIGFLKGNIIKYSMRSGRKDGSDDAGKAKHYMQKLSEMQGQW